MVLFDMVTAIACVLLIQTPNVNDNDVESMPGGIYKT